LSAFPKGRKMTSPRTEKDKGGVIEVTLQAKREGECGFAGEEVVWLLDVGGGRLLVSARRERKGAYVVGETRDRRSRAVRGNDCASSRKGGKKGEAIKGNIRGESDREVRRERGKGGRQQYLSSQ